MASTNQLSATYTQKQSLVFTFLKMIINMSIMLSFITENSYIPSKDI